MILLSCFILMMKKVTAHQQKVRFLAHPVHNDESIHYNAQIVIT